MIAPAESTPRASKRTAKPRAPKKPLAGRVYVTDIEPALKPEEMAFDVFVRPRTADAARRLARAFLADKGHLIGGATLAGWLNHNVIAGIDSAEDEMKVNPKTGDAFNGYGEKIGDPAKVALLPPRTYIVLIDEETELKYRNAAEETGIPIEELIAGGAAHQNNSNSCTETHLDPELVLWLIEASADVRKEKRKAGRPC